MIQTRVQRLAALVALTGLALGLGATQVAAVPEVGKPAPAFAAQTTDGKKIALANYKGKSAVLLNFYANF